MIGRTLAHYEITSALGKGGMGEVYRARDHKLGRDVALKLLPASTASDPARLARFEQEARTVAGLNHPNIVTLFSVEQADGVHFLTMELVEGHELARELAPGGLPVERVVELGAALAGALAAAHASGVVHRDLKPANVMLTADGRLKVLDFGLAKLEASEPAQDLTAVQLSAPGQIAGTVPYMAPEQVRGEAVDARTDIFALGIVLYELATGRRPFDGATQGVISSAILRDTPSSVSSLRADAPPDLERIVARCLEKDPRRRYQSALDVAHELRLVGEGRAPETIRVVPPTPSTPLLGREEHLAEAVALLRDGARVLTVSGYGGTGKTRFGIELYRRLVDDYPGGAAFVSLASVTAAAEVLPTVSSTLDIAEAHGRSALDALCTVIGDQRVLLVLDNLEQVLDAAGDIAQLVARCPALQVVATSRAPLKISAESEFALPPLALPDDPAASPERLMACPSVALFVQRATKVKPDFRLDADSAPAVSEICRRLDGLPLALELAAARVRILGPAQLLQRLDHALDLLSSGDRDLPLRQRTLRTTISWSYSLLEPPEQQLLRRCSVFHEGWTFEAMEQVCFGDDDRWLALDQLGSLVEKGLVRVVGTGERYALLETIRAFAAEQLHAGGETEALRDAHARFYVEWTGRMIERFRGDEQIAAQGDVRADHANELAAAQWLISGARNGDQDALEQAMLLCGHLNWFWHVAGQHNTMEVLVDEVLELAADRAPSRGRALAHLSAGMVAITTGDWDRALVEWSAGREEGLAMGDERIAAEGSMGVGYTHLNCGRMAEAEAPIEDALARSAGGRDDAMQSLTLELKGMLLFQRGDLDGGMRVVEQGLEIQRRHDDCEGGGIGLSFLAQMHFARGDARRALELYEESRQTFERVGDRPEIARVLCETGWTALAAEDVPAARTAFRRAVQAYEEVGSPRGTGLALLGLAAVAAAEGDVERAVTIAAAADALAARAGVVCDHPMDPGVAARIKELEQSIPRETVEGIVAGAGELTPAAVLAMVDTGGGAAA